MDSGQLSVKNDLVVRALNYHGQQLTNFMKDQPLFRHLDLKGVDYHLYHNRSRELRMEDRGRRLLLHRFISQNMESLFRNCGVQQQQKGIHKMKSSGVDNIIPPIETFLSRHVSKEDRIRHFFEIPCEGDILYCSVNTKNISGLLLNVLCFAPESGKARMLVDLGIKCFCPAAETVPSEEGRPYDQGDNVCVVILEVKRDNQRLLVGMKYESMTVPPPEVDRIKLGQITHLPREYTVNIEAKEQDLPYEWFLEKSTSFTNPTGVEELTKELGLSFKVGKSSLFTGLMNGNYDPKTTASALRHEQCGLMAFKHVALGIKYFKAGNNVEAFQCLNKALSIDKDNVEGLVARGALYANNGSLDRAIADFRAGLASNPEHKNAKKYLSETLIAVARNHEDDKNYQLAMETFEKVLQIEPDHRDAKEGIWHMRQKIMGVTDHGIYPGPETFLSAFGPKTPPAERGKEGSKKKKRHRSSSASSSSSSSSGSSSSSSSSSRSNRKRKKKSRRSRSKSHKTGDRKRDSVSPFSKRMPDGYAQPMGALPPMMVNTLAPSVLPGVLPGIKVPPNTAAVLPVNPYIQYPVENRPVSRVESEISRHSNEPGPPGEDNTGIRTDSKTDRPVASVVPTAPLVGTMYNIPPPGYYGLPPGYPPITGYPSVLTHRDVEYERAVQKFLDQTSRSRDSRDERYRGRREYDHRRRPSESDRRGEREQRRERENSNERSRPTDSSDRRKRSSKERESSEQRSKRSSLEEKKDFMKMSVDEIAETVNVHYNTSKTTTGSSKSKRRSRSTSDGGDEKKGSKKNLEDSDKDDRNRKEKDRKSKVDVDKHKKSERDDRRGFSPNAKKVFKMESDESSEEDGEPEPAKSKDSRAGNQIWKPTGTDRIPTLEKVSEVVASLKGRLVEKSNGDNKDENDKYIIKLDKETGMYTRVLKPGATITEERVVRKLSRSPVKEKSPSDSKSSRKRGRERSRSRGRKSRSRSRGRKSRSRSRGRKSRSRERKDRKSRSKSRDRSRSRDKNRRSRSRDRKHRERSKSREKNRRRSRERSKSRDKDRRRRSKSRERTRRDRSKSREKSRRSRSKSMERISDWRDSDKELKGIRSGTDEIKREMERIAAERAAILSQLSGAGGLNHLPRPVPTSKVVNIKKSDNQDSSQRDHDFRVPDKRIIEGRWGEQKTTQDDDDGFSSMDNVLSSVLKAVNDKGSKIDRPTASKILPGAKSYEDIQAYLNAAKKEKIEKLKEKNKDFVRSESRR